MRFVTFAGPAGLPIAGFLRGKQVVDLSHPACKPLLGGLRPSMQDLLDHGLERCRPWADARIDGEALLDLDAVRLLAPIPRPGKIVGAAYNFTDALAERQMAHPAEPVTFVRSGRTVIGPGEAILVPPDVGLVGYEAELAVVIGRTAMRVDRLGAMRCVAGYVAHNDVSGSGLIKSDGGNFVRGKNLPASSPLGPWIATADEIPDPQDVAISLDIDGRKLQDGSTRTMLFGVAELISWISHRMPLEPGDVVAAGTPAGVAAMHQPPAWLAPGMTVNVHVQGLGTLSNPVQAGEPFLDR